MGKYVYAWLAFIVLAFVMAFAALVPGRVWESAGQSGQAGGAYAFSAAFVSLAVTFASTRAGNNLVDYIPILLAFAVVMVFGAATRWELSGWQLGILLLGLGVVQAVVTRRFLPHAGDTMKAIDDPPAKNDEFALEIAELERLRNIAVVNLWAEKARVAAAEARVAELEATLHAPVPTQLLRLAGRLLRS